MPTSQPTYQLQEINRQIDQDVKGFLETCDDQYAQKINAAADAILNNLKNSPIVLLSGPSGSGKTTTALKIEEELNRRGVKSHTISMDNYFKTLDLNTCPRTADGLVDFESPLCMDMDLLQQHFKLLAKGDVIRVPKFEFARQMRNEAPGIPCVWGRTRWPSLKASTPSTTTAPGAIPRPPASTSPPAPTSWRVRSCASRALGCV